MVLISTLFACHNRTDETLKEESESNIAEVDTSGYRVDEKLLFRFDYAVANVPSPSTLINDIASLKLPYKPDLMVNFEEVNSNGSAKEEFSAMLLGMNNADAVYALVNNQTGDFIKRMNFSLVQIEKLGLSTLVEKSILDRAQSQLVNSDSLAILIDGISKRVDTFLRNNERVKIAALSFSGSWLETLYLILKLHENANKDQGKKIRGFLYDQKVHLNNLVKLMAEFKKDPFMFELKNGFEELSDGLMQIKSVEDLDDLQIESFQLRIIKLREDALRW